LKHFSNCIEQKIENHYPSIIQGDDIDSMNVDEMQSNASTSLNMDGNSAALEVHLMRGPNNDMGNNLSIGKGKKFNSYIR
jgi:aspartate ammonia-lyase